MQSIARIITGWAADRPLKALNKHDLFRYPDADPDPDAQWAFMKEILLRNAAHVDHGRRAALADAAVVNAKATVTKAQLRVSDAEARWKQTDGASAAVARDTLETAKRSLTAALSFLSRCESEAAVLKADMDKLSQRQDILSGEEIATYYRTRYAPEWIRILKRWQNADYLEAQKYSWDSFLKADFKTVTADSNAYFYAERIAGLVGEEKTTAFKDVNALWQFRVLPSVASRRAFMDKDLNLKVAGLEDQQRQFYWRWQKEFNEITKAHGWLDDSGVAYDTRMVGADHA